MSAKFVEFLLQSYYTNLIPIWHNFSNGLRALASARSRYEPSRCFRLGMYETLYTERPLSTPLILNIAFFFFWKVEVMMSDPSKKGDEGRSWVCQLSSGKKSDAKWYPLSFSHCCKRGSDSSKNASHFAVNKIIRNNTGIVFLLLHKTSLTATFFTHNFICVLRLFGGTVSIRFSKAARWPV